MFLQKKGSVDSFRLLSESDDELKSRGLKIGPRKLILSWIQQQQSGNICTLIPLCVFCLHFLMLLTHAVRVSGRGCDV